MTIRLLVVDDHALVREGLVRLLSGRAGLDVVGDASSGKQALELTSTTAPDVVLLDIALADESGLELIGPLLAARPEMKILMLTMHAEPEFSEIAIERGARGLVSKDASVDALSAAIEAAARGETLSAEGTLSVREREILEWIGTGASNEEIAAGLSIRPKTVDGHAQRLMAKLGIHTRAGLVAYACRTPFKHDLA